MSVKISAYSVTENKSLFVIIFKPAADKISFKDISKTSVKKGGTG